MKETDDERRQRLKGSIGVSSVPRETLRRQRGQSQPQNAMNGKAKPAYWRRVTKKSERER